MWQVAGNTPCLPDDDDDDVMTMIMAMMMICYRLLVTPLASPDSSWLASSLDLSGFVIINLFIFYFFTES